MSERITKATLKKYVDPYREIEIADSEVRGFAVRFRPGKSPAFFFRYSSGNGHRKKIAIGLATETTPEKARETAREFRSWLVRGVDPASERKRVFQNPTVEALSVRYMKEHADRNKKTRSARNDAILWRLHILPVIGSKQTNSVDVEDALEIKGRLAKQTATGNRALALLSKAMNLAEVWKYRPQNSNPCKFVDRYPEVKRERILDPEEIARFGVALEKHESDCPEVVTLIRALLLTGAREREIMDAKLEQLDRRRRILILGDSKTGQGIISLSDPAFDLLDGIPRGKSPWLIPGPVAGHPVRSPWSAWRRICKTAGIVGLRIHDLRHIFGSYSHHYGASQKTVASLLRHKQLATAARYMQAIDGEAMQAANRTAEGIAAMLNPSSTTSPETSEAPQEEARPSRG